VAVTETVALIKWSISVGKWNYFAFLNKWSCFWKLRSFFFFSFVSEFTGSLSTPLVAFPHDEVSSFVTFHTLFEGLWGFFVWAEGTKTSSLGVLKISKDVMNNSNCMTSLLKNESATSGTGNIKDILGSVWILDGKVFISEDQIKFSHIKVFWFTFLGLETSPGTKELLRGDVATILRTCLLNVTLLLSLNAGQSLWITFEKFLLFMALLTALRL
jgi:hypothetical protein